MKTTCIILTLLAGELAARTPFTYESAIECVSAAQLDADPSVDDVVILDRSTGIFRLGFWNGTSMDWQVEPGGVSDAGFMCVGNPSNDPGQAMGIAVGSALWNRTEIFTPATQERSSITGLCPLPSAMVMMSLPSPGDSSLDDFIIASSDIPLTGTLLGSYRNNGPATAPSNLSNSPAGILTSGNHVSSPLGPAAVFMADSSSLQIWRWDEPLLAFVKDASLPGLDSASRYIAGRFGSSGFHNYITYVAGENSFHAVSQHAVGSEFPFDTPASWPADLNIGSAYAIPSPLGTSGDWLMLVSLDGSTAELLDFSPEDGPALRESFTAPPGLQFTAAIAQPGGNFILLNGTGGHSTGWQRATYNGSTHDLSASQPLPGIRRSSAVATLFTYSAEPWVNPDAALLSLHRIGSWTTSTMAGGVGFLDDLGVPTGLANPGFASYFDPNGGFAVPSQVRTDVSLATLGTALNSTRIRVSFSPPPGKYKQPVTAANNPAPLAISINADDQASAVIHFRTNNGPWQTYSATKMPSLAATGSLDAFAEIPNGGHSAVTHGNYIIGPLSPLESAAFVDANGDGIDDNWAKTFGVGGAGDDADGDGRTALQEYQDGTDPNDPNSNSGTEPSAPELVITSFDAISRIATLRLHGSPGHLHNIEWSPSLAPGSWLPLGSDFTMPVAGFIDAQDFVSSEAKRFYRGIAR